MIAEIVSVGTELLMGQIVDSNSAYISARLPEVGYRVYFRQTVGDNLERLTQTLKLALSRADVVITIGGLGPTMDDLTREGIASALDEPLILDHDLQAELQEKFRQRGYPMVESILRQAYRPACARPLPNPNGTAPGLIAEKGDKAVIALPGPPAELIPMFNDHVLPYLRERAGGEPGVIVSRILRVCGMGESLVEDRIKDLMQGANPTVAPYAKTGEVHLRVTASAPSTEQAQAMIADIERQIRERLGNAIYGVDDQTLEGAVMELLWARGATVAVAESCTGGLIGHRLTEVPGSSKALIGGVVAYSNEVKMRLLNVPEETLREYGAVSEPTARAMAEGIRQLMGADFGIGTTGIAGPTGGTPEKPVGLVYIAVASPSGTRVREHRFLGRRSEIKWRASQAALVMLREELL
ncbi:MAG: competence/damage-inducible protein A [Chthonomonadetes bacterium]|nr:competence/damage-inducible protein A [Chthonomonadetes bacterium]